MRTEYGEYSVILADPPWGYRRNTGRGAAENHYPSMTLDELADMRDQVQALAKKDCALFLWCTFPTLPDLALPLIDAWGFTYRTAAFIWLKVDRKTGRPIMVGGNYTRANVEPCLIATYHGIPKRKDRAVRQVVTEPEVIVAPRAPRKRNSSTHSVKPGCIYERIETLYGGPYIELFATRRVDGWDSTGLVFGDDYTSERRTMEVSA